MQIEIERYAPAKRAEWDKFVAGSKNGTFLFERAFMEYHADRFVDYSLMAFGDGELIAILPASISADTVTSHAGLTFGGWITDARMTADLMLAIFKAAQRVMSEDASRLVYKAAPNIYHREPADEDLYALFKNNAVLTRRDLASALRPNDVPAKVRREANRCARKYGLAVEESEDFEGFHRLLTEVLSRHEVRPVHSVEELTDLKRKFRNNIRLFVTMQEEQMIAGVLCFDNGRICHTQYMANPEPSRTMRALDLAIIHIIEREFRERAWISFGISTEDQGKYLNEGLLRQKEKFGATSYVHDFYELAL